MIQEIGLTLKGRRFRSNLFAAHLRSWRAANKLTCDQLGSLLGVSKATISRWENEKGQPEICTFLLLCAIMKRSTDLYLTVTDATHETASIMIEKMI